MDDRLQFPQEVTDHMNPYAAPSMDEVSPERMAEGRKLARAVASSGRANGAILKKLRDIGIEGRVAEEIASDALTVRARTERVLGMATIGAGICVVAIGLVLSRYFVVRIPVGVATFGAFLCMIGGVKLFHRSHRPRM